MYNAMSQEPTDICLMIRSLRGTQVILDRDLAKLYLIETRILKQAVNRNKARFPSDFMFVLTEKEVECLVSQSVIPSKSYFGGSLPYAFTEQGVANLSSVLNSEKAIQMNISIIRAFVSMRRFIYSSAQIFQRLDKVEIKQIEHDRNFERVFKALETEKPKQGIFYDGQVFDAYHFVSDLIRSAERSIVLIDNFVDDTVLSLLAKRRKGVDAVIHTQKISKQLRLDLNKYNSQYEPISVREFKNSHDRFLIVDGVIYHFGASLKDLGKRWFAFSKFEKGAVEMLSKL